jgi:thiamine-monophosphate kinase
VSTPDNSDLATGEEFDAIRTLLARWGSVARGVGDDAAVLDIPRGDFLVASADATVEQRHFRRGWMRPREIGYRAAVAALSDLAAMAARPLGILLALALPEAWQADLESLADGLGEAAREYKAPIVGGNITRASELSLNLTVLGTAHEVLRRNGLEAGDTIWVTGVLGGPGAAIRAWSNGKEPSEAHRARFLRPRARIHEAIWLAAAGATAAIDVSDGLAADLSQLAAASRVTIDAELERIPIISEVTCEEAVASGEEYELIVGARHEIDASAFRERFGIPLTRIGRVRSGQADVVLTRGGVRVANPEGYDHLSR